MKFPTVPDVALSELGPLRTAEPAFGRRLRVHQAWYRVAILGVHNFGATKPPHCRKLGSILPQNAADAGMNFISSDAEALFADRHASGWGIDPVRSRAYMTSSQTLTLNVLGPLAARKEWLAATLNVVRSNGPEIETIHQVHIEHAIGRGPDGFGDQTHADAIVVAEGVNGPIVIAIETKYSDRFNSRSIEVGDRYQGVSSLWRQRGVAANSSSNQLARVHALGAKVGIQSRPNERLTAELLLLRHGTDEGAGVIAEGYRRKLNDPNLLHDISLQRLFAAMRETSGTDKETNLSRELDLRYSSLEASDMVWNEFSASSSRARERSQARLT